MIQNIAPHQFKNEYRPVSPQKDSIALYYEEHTALMRRTQTGIEFPTFGELERLNEEIYENSIYLFTIDEKQYYLVDNLNREPHSEFTMENTEIFRTADPQYSAFAGITGYQLYQWYQTTISACLIPPIQLISRDPRKCKILGLDCPKNLCILHCEL